MKKTTIVFVCAIVLLLIAVSTALMIVHTNVSVCIFADLEECESIASADGSFSEYTEVSSDKHVKVRLTDFFAGKYKCDGFKFEIFAYEFDSIDSARAYFEEVTGKNSDGLDTNFSLSSGLLNSYLVVFDSNRAYMLYAPTMDISDVAQFLSGVFSIKII